MIVDLFLVKEQKGRLAWLSLVGVLVAAGLSYYIWDGTDPALQNMLVADGYALFLNLVILTAAALAILFSVEYTARTGLALGEYYTLLLLSTAGMMLMAAAINLMTITLMLLSPDCAYFYIVPHPYPSIPGEIVYADGADPYNLIVMHQSTGGPDNPVIGINCDCPPPIATDQASWGVVKRLYR